MQRLDMNSTVIIALDFKNKHEVFQFLQTFGDEKLFLKVGMELFYREGAPIVAFLKQLGHRVFLDLKLHDIPQTVRSAMRQLAALQVDMVTVHASGGLDMLRAAVEGLNEGTPVGEKRPLCLGVTVLTSASPAVFKDEIASSLSVPEAVSHFAQLSQEAGLDGVVCSVHETKIVKQVCGRDFVTVTPGIRQESDSQNDQARAATPEKAREAGSSFIVVGRPITQAIEPTNSYHAIQTRFLGGHTAPRIADHLLRIGAVSLRPREFFTWASGIKSPIYCDNRLTLSHPAVRKDICRGLVSMIRNHYPDVEVIAGTATAGIPHAAWVSDAMDLPMVYVRGTPKAHGKGNQIEGMILPGQKVVVIEDLISTGGSSLDCVRALQDAGCDVLGVAAIFSYGLPKAAEQFAAANIKVMTLSDYGVLLDVACGNGLIAKEDLTTLHNWRSSFM